MVLSAWEILVRTTHFVEMQDLRSEIVICMIHDGLLSSIVWCLVALTLFLAQLGGSAIQSLTIFFVSLTVVLFLSAFSTQAIPKLRNRPWIAILVATAIGGVQLLCCIVLVALLCLDKRPYYTDDTTHINTLLTLAKNQFDTTYNANATSTFPEQTEQELNCISSRPQLFSDLATHTLWCSLADSMMKRTIHALITLTLALITCVMISTVCVIRMLKAVQSYCNMIANERRKRTISHP